MKKIITVILFLVPLSLSAAAWDRHGLIMMKTDAGAAGEPSATYFKDSANRTVIIKGVEHWNDEQAAEAVRIKNLLYSWKSTVIKSMQFDRWDNIIHAIILAGKMDYKNIDLCRYIPGGITFSQSGGRLWYKFRIIVGSQSFMIRREYSGEEQLMQDIYIHIEGIKKGTIKAGESGDIIITERPGESKKMDDGLKTGKPVERRGCFDLAARGLYLLPVGVFSEKFMAGYGGMLSLGIRDIAISYGGKPLFHLEFDLSSGYWHMATRNRSFHQNLSNRVLAAYIIPIYLTVGYRIIMPKGFSLALSIAVGINYNYILYRKFKSVGYYLNISKKEWAPSLMPGIRFEYAFRPVIVFAGAEYMVIFERRLNIMAVIFSVGIGYLF